MRYFLSLLALAPAALAQNATSPSDFATGLIAALTAGGYNKLLEVVTTVGASPEGIKLLGDLQTGYKTLLAPTDVAFTGVQTNISGNATLLAEVLSYHVLDGNYTVDSVANAPDHTIARTTLQGDAYAKIGGGRGQALTLYQQNGTGILVDAPYKKWQYRPLNISTQGVAHYANVSIISIPEVINLPPSISAFTAQNASTISGALASVGMLEPLESLTGCTLFLPTNEAVAKLPADAITSLNSSTLITILQNHATNNSVLYSTSLGKVDAFSLAGEQYTFAKNGSTLTVTSGNVTANVVYADIITANGVIHLIDTVLLNPAKNEQAVSSIISSAAAAASQTGTATVSDIGVGPTSGVSNSTGGAKASASASATASAGSSAFATVTAASKFGLAVVLGAAVLLWV